MSQNEYRAFIDELKREQDKLKKELFEIQNHDVVSEQQYDSTKNPSVSGELSYILGSEDTSLLNINTAAQFANANARSALNGEIQSPSLIQCSVPSPMSNTIAFQKLLERSLKLQKRIENSITDKNNELLV